MLDVLNVVRSLQKSDFRLTDVYGHSKELQLLHPGNLHVCEKIRQQLQRLRDMELVEFLGGGKYRLKV
ncbi:MAG: Dam-replacing domain protein [Terriglobia bacterium]